MAEPVRMRHNIEFETYVKSDSETHRKIAEEVIGELQRLAPLMIRERELTHQLDAVRAQMECIR